MGRRELTARGLVLGALITTVFTAANVGLTMILGTLLALLLVRLSTWVRLLLTAGLVLVWAMPPVVAVQVWRRVFDEEPPE